MARDYDKAKESTEPASKGHASAVREAIEDHKHGHVPHPTMHPSMPHSGMMETPGMGK